MEHTLPARAISLYSGIFDKLHELLDRDPRTPNELSERASVQLSVIGDREMPPGRMVVDHVRAPVMIVDEPKLAERPPCIPP